MTKIFYSPRIKEIIDFMAVYYDEHDCFPKLDEIGKALNLTKQRVGILLKNAEKLIIVNTLGKFNGHRAMTAEALGIDKTTLWRKMKKYGLL